MPCDCCKRYLEHLDGKLKCLFSHMNSSSRHGMFSGRMFGRIGGSYRFREVLIVLCALSYLHRLTIIHISDSHCCEKDSSCAGIRNTSNLQGRSENSVDTLSGSDDHGTQTSARPVTHKWRSSSRPREAAKNAASSFSSQEESGEDSASDHQSLGPDTDKILSDNCFLSNGCHLAPRQKEKLADLVKTIQSDFPVLVSQMKQSNVRLNGANLVISKGYAVEHFPPESQNITLEGPGRKKWHVRLHVRPDRTSYTLTGHWGNFVRDNHLREKDICLFQPINGHRGFRFLVYLLHEGRRSRKLSSATHVRKKSGNRGNAPSLDLHERRVAQEPHVLDDAGGPSQPPPYDVLVSTRLTAAQEKIVAEKVKAIQSEETIFVAAMNEKILGDDGTFSLNFNTKYAAPHLPDGKQTLTLRRSEWSKAWRTKMQNRQMYAGELREFADHNRLRTGDLCLFEPVKNEVLAMMIHIIRSEQYH
ncbi:hypothetical protein ACP70R_025016 [Stipagrostis hirtigluma subsp. patula]